MPPKYVNPYFSYRDGSVSRPPWLLVGGKSCMRFLTDGAASLHEKTSINGTEIKCSEEATIF